MYFIIFCRYKSFLHQYIALFLVGLMWDSRGTHFLRGTHFSMTHILVFSVFVITGNTVTGFNFTKRDAYPVINMAILNMITLTIPSKTTAI